MSDYGSSYGGRGPTINGVLWTETILAAFFVFGRVYTRKFILRTQGWDDLFLLLAWVFLAAYAALIAAGTAWGVGQRRADIPPDHYIQAMKMEIIGQGVCIFNIVVSKAAVSFLLLRIVARVWHKVFIWFCFITTTIIVTWATIAVFIQCLPVAKVWDNSIEGECWLDFASIGLATSAYSVVVDFALAIIPCFIVWELNMKAKDKMLTICGLSLGIFAGVCGIMRTVALTSLSSFEEYIYDTSDMLIYSGTENFVFCLCASIPVLRPLWSAVVRGYASSNDRSYQLSDMPNGSKDAENVITGTGGSKSNPSIGRLGNGPGPETRIYASAFRDGSDETILRDQSQERHGKGNDVHMETKVSIHYSEMSTDGKSTGGKS